MRRSVLRSLLLAAVALQLCVGPASSMALKSLENVDTSALEAKGWQVRKAADRLTVACGDCAEFTAADILLNSASDGTEERIRAGTTTAATMLDICRKNAEANGSECFGLKDANLRGAVGFVSDVGLGPMGFAATYMLWQDGQRLTIRNIAPSREKAAEVGRLMFDTLAPQIVE